MLNIETRLMTNLKLTGVLFILIGLLSLPSNAEAQSRKRLRELEKVGESQEAEKEDAGEEGKARHMSIQSKRTRKEMKRYKKMNKNYNKNRKPLFRKRYRR